MVVGEVADALAQWPLLLITSDDGFAPAGDALADAIETTGGG